MIKLKWPLFFVFALILAWRIIIVNVSEYLASKNDSDALKWKHNTPSALREKASDLLQLDAVESRKLVSDAAWYNPVNARAFFILSQALEREGKLGLARKSAEFASFLGPRDNHVQNKLGIYWASKGEPILALAHWSVAIDTKPELSKELFPIMLDLVDKPQMRVMLNQAFKDVPKWWDSFLLFALSNAANEETIKAIYYLNDGSIGHDARKAYLDYLIRMGLYNDAYFVWLNALPGDQLSKLGNINDGGFDYAMADEGFGWRPTKDPGFNLAPEPTYGHSGQFALHVSFNGEYLSNRVLYQYLMLEPGVYEFSGRVRIDGLSVGNGVRWYLNCADLAGKANLVKGELFTGAAEWQRFTLKIEVPKKECAIQEIFLGIDADVGSDHSNAAGSIWFDDLAIQKSINS